MGDEDNAFSLGSESPQDRQQFGNLARREIGGWLVKDQQLRVAQHGLEDLDPLPASKRQVGDHRVRIEAKPIAKALLSDPLRHFASAQNAARLRPSKHDVLDHRHGVHQHEMLMDHRDAARHRVRRPVSGEWLAAKDDRTGVGRDQAEQHLHECAFSGAVLSQKSEDLPGIQLEIDAVDRPHRAKAANDAVHCENGGHDPNDRCDDARPRRPRSMTSRGSSTSRRCARLAPSARS